MQLKKWFILWQRNYEILPQSYGKFFEYLTLLDLTLANKQFSMESP